MRSGAAPIVRRGTARMAPWRDALVHVFRARYDDAVYELDVVDLEWDADLSCTTHEVDALV